MLDELVELPTLEALELDDDVAELTDDAELLEELVELPSLEKELDAEPLAELEALVEALEEADDDAESALP